jgi:hypothetical protein
MEVARGLPGIRASLFGRPVPLNFRLLLAVGIFLATVERGGLVCRKLAPAQELGAGKGNRTLIASLEGWSFTIKLCPRFAEKT